MRTSYTLLLVGLVALVFGIATGHASTDETLHDAAYGAAATAQAATAARGASAREDSRYEQDWLY